MTVRPEQYADIPDDAWNRIQEFREVARERDRADRSFVAIAKELLGLTRRYSDVGEVVDELFADDALPATAREQIEVAAELIEDDEPEAARVRLREEFGSVCDEEFPEAHAVTDSGRTSLCHRHEAGYTSPDDHASDVAAFVESAGDD